MFTPNEIVIADTKRLLGTLALRMLAPEGPGCHIHWVHGDQVAADLGHERLVAAWDVLTHHVVAEAMDRGLLGQLKERCEVDHPVLPVGSALRYFIADVRHHLPEPADRLGFAWSFRGRVSEEHLVLVMTLVAEVGIALLTELQELYDSNDCDCCDNRKWCECHTDCGCIHELAEPSNALLAVLDDIAVRIHRIR